MGASDAARREAEDDLPRDAVGALESARTPRGARGGAAAPRRCLVPAAAGARPGLRAGER
jgi:hypothetical protein